MCTYDYPPVFLMLLLFSHSSFIASPGLWRPPSGATFAREEVQSSPSVLLILLDACLPVGAVNGLSRPPAPPRPCSSIPCQTSDQNLIRSRRHLSLSPPSITDVRLLFSPLFSFLSPSAWQIHTSNMSIFRLPDGFLHGSL